MKNNTRGNVLPNRPSAKTSLVANITAPSLQPYDKKAEEKAKRIIQKSRKKIITALSKLSTIDPNAEKIMVEAILESGNVWEFLGYPIQLLNDGLMPSAQKSVETIAINYSAIAQQQRNLHGVAFGKNNIVPFGA